MVIRYANLVPVFFDTYSGTLGRSHFYVLRYLQWYAAPIWFWRFFGTYRNILYQSGISGQDAQSASVTCSVFFLSAGSVSQRKVASGRAAAEEGWLLLGLRETALLRQGLLSEPKASSGPAAMLLAVSRSPSSIPRRSPCPERCHLPLASLNHIHLSKTQKHPRLHPPNDTTFLWRPSTTSIHTKKARHLHIPKTPDSHQSYISWKWDSNSRPLHYEWSALPTELFQLMEW